MSRSKIIALVCAGVVVVIIGVVVLVWANLGKLAQTAMDTPEGKKGFIDGFKQNCTKSAKAATAGRVDDSKIEAYCDCSAQRMLEKVNGDEIVDMMKGSMTPALQQKVNDVVAQCQSAIK